VKSKTTMMQLTIENWLW